MNKRGRADTSSQYFLQKVKLFVIIWIIVPFYHQLSLFHILLKIVNKRGQADNSIQSIICQSPFFFPAYDNRKKKEEGISNEERNFLKDVAEYPLSVVTERYGRLGLSVYRGNCIKLELLEKGLIEQERVSVPHGS